MLCIPEPTVTAVSLETLRWLVTNVTSQGLRQLRSVPVCIAYTTISYTTLD